MSINEPSHPTDYRMVKLTDGTLLVGTVSVDEKFLRILSGTPVKNLILFFFNDFKKLFTKIILN